MDAPRRRRSGNRRWAIAAGLLWLITIALAAFYMWDVHTDTSAAASQTPASETSMPSTAVLDGGRRPAAAAPSASATSPTTIGIPTTTEAPTTTASTTTTTTEPPSLFVAAGGDVLADRKVGVFMDENGGEAVFTHVRPLLETAHLTFVNLEGPLSDKGTRAAWKEYTFRGRPAMIDGLVSAGIDVVSLANNHSNDYGTAALLDTIARLDEAGVHHAGAGADAAAASAPAILLTPAGTVAVLAFTDIIPGGFAAGSDTPGVNATTPNRKKLLADIAAADKRADYVIVSFHWGTEYESRANREQRRLAHQVIDAGADLVIGHHPHVIQGLELYRDRLIAYSLGDFVWDHYSVETGETFVLQVTAPRAGPPSAMMAPVYLDESTGVPEPVTGKHAASILSRLARLSSDLGVELMVSGDRAFFNTTEHTE
ncbi:MAG: CapA family protein [Actinobacteria bacterium]|nr:CapA family protein [Actinomycetota bacterium]